MASDLSRRRGGRFAYYPATDPRVAELALLARSLAADNVAGHHTWRKRRVMD